MKLMIFLCMSAFLICETNASSALGECVNNLRMIDAAKEQCAYERNLSNGAVLATEWFTPFFKGNVIPQCPAGGTYTIEALGTFPKCSIAGHSVDALQERGRIKALKRKWTFPSCIALPIVLIGAILAIHRNRKFRGTTLSILIVASLMISGLYFHLVMFADIFDCWAR